MISEAQYTEDEYKHIKGWGHSTFLDVLELAAEANVKRLVIIHHDPDHDDTFMDQISEFCQKKMVEKKYTFSCMLAQEGNRLNFEGETISYSQ